MLSFTKKHKEGVKNMLHNAKEKASAFAEKVINGTKKHYKKAILGTVLGTSLYGTNVGAETQQHAETYNSLSRQDITFQSNTAAQQNNGDQFSVKEQEDSYKFSFQSTGPQSTYTPIKTEQGEVKGFRDLEKVHEADQMRVFFTNSSTGKSHSIPLTEKELTISKDHPLFTSGSGEVTISLGSLRNNTREIYETLQSPIQSVPPTETPVPNSLPWEFTFGAIAGVAGTMAAQGLRKKMKAENIPGIEIDEHTKQEEAVNTETKDLPPIHVQAVEITNDTEIAQKEESVQTPERDTSNLSQMLKKLYSEIESNLDRKELSNFRESCSKLYTKTMEYIQDTHEHILTIFKELRSMSKKLKVLHKTLGENHFSMVTNVSSSVLFDIIRIPQKEVTLERINKSHHFLKAMSTKLASLTETALQKNIDVLLNMARNRQPGGSSKPQLALSNIAATNIKEILSMNGNKLSLKDKLLSLGFQPVSQWSVEEGAARIKGTMERSLMNQRLNPNDAINFLIESKYLYLNPSGTSCVDIRMMSKLVGN